MKNLNYSLLRFVGALMVGMVLVAFPTLAGKWLVITLGVVFAVPALVAVITYFVQHRSGEAYFPLEAVGSLIFGIWLMVMPNFFANLLTIVLGVVLMIGGVYQVVSLLLIRRTLPVSAWFYVVPVLILIAGGVAAFNPFETREVVSYILGISCLFYAASELATWLVFRRNMKNSKPQAKDFADVEDAEIVEEEEV